MTYEPLDIYSAAVLEHFRQPRLAGVLSGPGIAVGRAGSIKEGGLVEFSLRPEAGRAAELRFRAYGCPHTIAAASLAAERLAGQPLETLAAFRGLELAKALDLPVEKLPAVLRVEDALKTAVKNAK